MNKLNYTIGALVFAVIALGFGLLIKAPIVNVQPVVQYPMGAVSGPSVDFPSFTINGVSLFADSAGFNNSSTTLCWFKAPSATSTLIHASYSISVATATAIELSIGKSTNPTATTTELGTCNVGASVISNCTASTSPSGAGTAENLIFAPNQYLVVKFAAAAITPTTNSIKGTCKALWVAF